MTSSTVRISTKIIPRVHRKPGKIMLQHRYYLYQTTFPINEYGVWLEISYMKRFFVTAVYRVTTQSNVILVEGDNNMNYNININNNINNINRNNRNNNYHHGLYQGWRNGIVHASRWTTWFMSYLIHLEIRRTMTVIPILVSLSKPCHWQ